MKRTLLTATALLGSLLPALALAGPNWQAIEYARSVKVEAREEAAVQQSRHDTAMQKLHAACEKASGDAEVYAACQEMMAACDEAM